MASDRDLSNNMQTKENSINMTQNKTPQRAAAEPVAGVVIRVGIVEDDERIRSTLVEMVDGTPGFRCVSANASAEEALTCPWIGAADVTLMDINLPGKSGIECVRELKARHPALQIMMLTVYEDTERIFDSLKNGASGYMLKRTPPAELINAIRDLHAGGSPMSSRIARKVVAAFSSAVAANPTPSPGSPMPSPGGVGLTPRQKAILEKLANGFQYKEIADQLEISVNTVRTHLRCIYEKLHVQNRTEAVVKYLGK